MREFEESPLVAGSGDLWRQATRAKFLSAIGDGTLPEDAFRRWLAQDYLFAKGLTSFQAIVTAKAPRKPQRLLIAGLSALEEEMDWFESSATDRGVDLGADPHPICRRYVDFLIASAYSQPFEVLFAILYGVEVSYLVAWSSLQATGPYADVVKRWSSEGFVKYVQGLLTSSTQFRHPDPRGAAELRPRRRAQSGQQADRAPRDHAHRSNAGFPPARRAGPRPRLRRDAHG